MPFQTVVNDRIGAGRPGQLAFEDRGMRASPALLASANAANNVFGRVFTIATNPDDPTASAQTVTAGGTGPIIGILANPDEHVIFGQEFTTSLTLPNGVVAGFLSTGYVWAELTNAATPGDLVFYSTSTGELTAAAPGAAVPAGTALVPSAIVYRYTASVTGANTGLACIRITDPNLPLTAEAAA